MDDEISSAWLLTLFRILDELGAENEKTREMLRGHGFTEDVIGGLERMGWRGTLSIKADDLRGNLPPGWSLDGDGNLRWGGEENDD